MLRSSLGKPCIFEFRAIRAIQIEGLKGLLFKGCTALNSKPFWNTELLLEKVCCWKMLSN